MLDLQVSEVDNRQVQDVYVQARAKLAEAASAFEELEQMLADKFMCVSKTDRSKLEDSLTRICSASFKIKIHAARIKQARAKGRIMTPCESVLTDKETL